MEWKAKPAVTRKAWLDELGRRLVWFFPADQVKDIVSDYREQFEAGHDHCRTEAEIIQGLGTPEEAAALLLEEEPSTKHNCVRHCAIWGAALVVCCCFLWVCLSTVSYGLFWVGVVSFIPIAASVLFWLVRGPARVMLEKFLPAEKRVSPVLVYYVPAALTLLCLIERLGLHLYSSHIASQFQANQMSEEAFQQAAQAIGIGNTLFLIGFLWLLVLLLAWVIFLCVKASVRYFPGAIHTFGTLGTVFFTLTYYSSMNFSLWNPLIDLLLSLLPYCVGLVTALAFQQWIDGRRPLPRIFRDRELSWQDWRQRLGVCLLGWFDPKQTLEILEDYQEQYELGREQGKSEEDLLAEMGRPETVVRDLLAEDRKARLRRRKTWRWAVLAGLSGWLLLGLMRHFEFGGAGFGWFYYQFSLQIGLFSVALGTVSLFFLLHVQERAAVERRFPVTCKPSLWLLPLPLLASVLVESLALWCICNAFDYQIPVLLGKPVTWFIIRGIECSVLLLTLLLIRTLNRCVSGSIRHFPAVPLLAGSMAHILCVGIYLSAMDLEYIHEDLAGTIRVNLTAMFPLLLGLVLAAALWLVLRADRKKEG